MKCGPERFWEEMRGGSHKMSARDAYYRAVERFPRDAVYKGYTYPQVRWEITKHNMMTILQKCAHLVQEGHKYVSEEYLRGCPAEVTAASSAEEDQLVANSVPLEFIQPRREDSGMKEQVQ